MNYKGYCINNFDGKPDNRYKKIVDYGITEDTPVNSLTKNTVKNLTRSIAGVLKTTIKYSKEV